MPAIRSDKKLICLVDEFSDVVSDALHLVMKFKEEESNRLYEITKEDILNL
jgi:hypothetical protein